jgi:hypothetical protein
MVDCLPIPGDDERLRLAAILRPVAVLDPKATLLVTLPQV